DPDWTDDMSNDDNWPTGFNQYTTIAFENSYLKLTAETDLDGWRLSWPFLTDFYLEASMQTPDCEDGDHYGLIFRVPAKANANKGYLFGITCDGRYSLRRWDGQNMYFPVNWTASDAIVEGEDSVNKLGILARDDELTLYINGQEVNEVEDDAFLEGSFGVFVGGQVTDEFTVWVDQIRYWENP
ncbi:MAG: family 16 glycoside hydrolase, partial [Brevefilum sp.]